MQLDPKRPATVAILTDFGTQDWYVGAMKGVIKGVNPAIPIVDVTHGIPPGDVAAGSFALGQSWFCFPRGTVFLCVVDPGVGTPRAPIAVSAGNSLFVGPDNGLFSQLPSSGRSVRKLENPQFRGPGDSNTFHGRDLFAPAAAWLAAGMVFEEAGPALQGLTPLPGQVSDEPLNNPRIVYVDHFGNAITNIPKANLTFQPDPITPRFQVGTKNLPLVKTYGDLSPGEAAGLVGSTGYLELVVNQGSASSLLGLSPGSIFKVLS